MWRSPSVQLQSAALPYRIDAENKVEILLITTRRSGRWSLPKGKIPNGMSLAASAAKEASEEAGVMGVIADDPCTMFRTTKRSPFGFKKIIEVWVYPLRVSEYMPDWPEKGQRILRWFPFEQAIPLLGGETFRDAVYHLTQRAP